MNDERITILVDGVSVETTSGTSVAVALLNAGVSRFRTSVQQESRNPLCAMGICFECRVWIDGVNHVRSCLISCTQGMSIRTDAS